MRPPFNEVRRNLAPTSEQLARAGELSVHRVNRVRRGEADRPNSPNNTGDTKQSC